MSDEKQSYDVSFDDGSTRWRLLVAFTEAALAAGCESGGVAVARAEEAVAQLARRFPAADSLLREENLSSRVLRMRAYGPKGTTMEPQVQEWLKTAPHLTAWSRFVNYVLGVRS